MDARPADVLAVTPQPKEDAFSQPFDSVDPRSYIEPNMRVTGDQGVELGTVEALERDMVTGKLTSMMVSHGLLGRKHTFILAENVQWVNEDSVVLRYTEEQFKALPDLPNGAGLAR